MRSAKSFVVLAAAAATFPLFLGSPASAGSPGADVYRAQLQAVPHDRAADSGSDVTGTARLVYQGDGRLSVRVTVRGASPNLPHLMHIHGTEQARAECPTLIDAPGGVDDRLIETVDGLDRYGPIQVTFATRGDTSPASGLALDRAPVANRNGTVQYSRTVTIPVPIGARLDDMHVVVHGEDLDDDGMYDPGPITALGAPLEAELPVACGEIDPVGHTHAGGSGHSHG